MQQGVDSISEGFKDESTLLIPADICQLSVYDFKKYLISSKEVVDTAVKNDEIRRKLDSINPNLFSQTFFNSCSACVIMRVLHENKFLTLEECTPSKELEIYSEIWISPGDISDPSKIISYFRKNGLPVYCLAVKDVTEEIMSKEPYLSPLFGLFCCADSNMVEKQKEWIVENSVLFDYSRFLLIKTNKNGSTHTLYGRHSDEGFDVIDAIFSSTIVKTYHSFHDYVEKKKDFTGVAFWLPSELTLPKEAFFRK